MAMTRIRAPFDWEVMEQPRSSVKFEGFFGVWVMGVDLCPDCASDQPWVRLIDTRELCSPRRLATEARMS